MKNGKSLEKEDLIKLLELAQRDEEISHNSLHRSFMFYATFLSTILAASIAAGAEASSPIAFFLILAGPIAAFFISRSARENLVSFYRTHYTRISYRAKIEQLLGLTEPVKHCGENNYWKNEPILPTSYISGRKFGIRHSYEKGEKKLLWRLRRQEKDKNNPLDHREISSEEFIETVAYQGLFKVQQKVYWAYKVLSSILGLIFFVLSSVTFAECLDMNSGKTQCILNLDK